MRKHSSHETPGTGAHPNFLLPNQSLFLHLQAPKGARSFFEVLCTLSPMASKQTSRTTFQKPKGTRDFYPLDLLRRRYITETWRAVSIRHGFEEIDGPTFEHAELYTVKSGEGILSELFSFSREGGKELYALRPEFTPTLARMYADKAASLPKPCRWFSIPSFFRAERPQRGRLREFVQWNCDVMGGDARSEADVVGAALGALQSVGLTANQMQLCFNHRGMVERILDLAGVPRARWDSWFNLLDRVGKLDRTAYLKAAFEIGAGKPTAQAIRLALRAVERTGEQRVRRLAAILAGATEDEIDERSWNAAEHMFAEIDKLKTSFLAVVSEDTEHEKWIRYDRSIVRGLAYYTGTVFEVLAEGERAIAGGGRYDNLIELFGGPSTPACGFGMGDVVLGNLLTDHGLMPGVPTSRDDGSELMDAVHNVTTGALGSVSLRPDVFVVSADEAADVQVIPLVAQLRRGIESDAWQQRNGKPWDADRYAIAPLHARPTDKSTRKEDKLWKDAQRVRAKFFATVSEGGHVQLKNIETREDVAGEWSANPSDENYVGRAFSGH